MKPLFALLTTLALISLTGCHSGRKPAQPGLYNTQTEAQVQADKVNAFTQKLRTQAKSLGVHAQYLLCGTAKPVHAANDYWLVETDKTGCPATAGQEDPHPDIHYQTPKSKPGGNNP